MKKIIGFVLYIGIMPAFFVSCNGDDTIIVNEGQSCLPENLQNGLIAAYTFSGGSLNDAIGSAHLTAFNAQPTSDRQGNSGCAFAFTGSDNSYLTSQNTAFLNDLDEMTVALWYQSNSSEYIGYEVLLSRGEGYGCDTYGEWSLGLYDAKKAVFGHANSVWEQVNQDGVTDWKFVTATCKKSDNTISIYVNGVLEQTATGSIDCGNGQIMTVEDIGDIFIGRKFIGSIDDITIYNRILTQAEITQLSELVPCCE